MAALIACFGLLACLAPRFLFESDDAAAFTGTSAVTANNIQKTCGLVTSHAGVDKVLADRMKSITKTAKLTDAMRLVAAAKVRGSQDGAEKAKPFSAELTSMIKGIVKKLKGSGLEAEIPMLKVPEKTTKVGILLITSTRGLCGPYNNFVTKFAKKRIEALNEQGIEPKLIIVGKKGLLATRGRLKNLKFTIETVDNDSQFYKMPDKISAAVSNQIAEKVTNVFLSGEVDKVEIIFTKFKNVLSSSPTVRTLLPLSPTGIEDPNDDTFKLTTEEGKMKVDRKTSTPVKAKEIETDVIFDQEPGVILNSMLPLYVTSQVLSTLFESQASELSNRMTAMKAATDNAKDLHKKLKLIFNKKRQASITTELCEIVTGGMALEGDDGAQEIADSISEEDIMQGFLAELKR